MGLLILLVSCFFLTRGFISEKLAESLIYQGNVTKSDAVVIENFDPNYLLFEEAAKLLTAGQTKMVFVPVTFNRSRTAPNRVDQEFAEVMCRISRIEGGCELIPFLEIEPIRLNAAEEVRIFLQDKEIHSIIILSPLFNSRRSFLVYQSVFASTGIKVSCLPVINGRNPSNWTESWHGIQEVFMEIGKLWYYRLVVLE